VASIHKRRGRYEVHWRDPGGSKHSRAFTRMDDARRYRREVERDLDRGTYIDRAAAKITLGEYGQGWLAGLSTDAATREAAGWRWGKHIEPGLGAHPLGQLAQRPSTIQAWVAGLLRDGLAPGYVREIVKSLSACLSAAVADHLIAANPVAQVSLPRAPQRRVVPWTTEMVAAVRSALPAHYQATVDVGAGLGLRQGEAFGLAAGDVNFLGRVVHVRRQVRLIGNRPVFAPPKGGKERDVPLPETVALWLSAHLAAHLGAHPARAVTLPWRETGGRPEQADLIFTSRRAGAVNRNSYNHAWRDALGAAGVGRGRENGYHALRHHFASLALTSGVDVRALSEYLGHHSPAFTLSVYCHLMPSAPGKLRSAIDAAMTRDDVSREQPAR
jgi:integrase